MRTTSRISLDAVAAGFAPVLTAAGSEAARLGEQLFAVVDLLDGSTQLRRALSDPARGGEDKARLVADLVGDRFDQRVLDVLDALVRERWSGDGDLADAVEELAADAVLASAHNAGDLETVQEELFRTVRLLAGQRDLRRALTDAAIAPAEREQVVRSLFADKASPVTVQLVSRAAFAPRGRSIVQSLTLLERLAARRRNRLVAVVTSATPLSRAQTARLASLLERTYDQPVQLNIAVDPQVVGGLRIEVGADVVNATVDSRIDDVRRRLAG